MTTPDTGMLDKVRKLLAMAEGAATQAEAEAFTERAATLMAKHGIDAALAQQREHRDEKPANRIIDVPNPWADVHAHLLAGLAQSMRCQCVLLNAPSGKRLHVFGFQSDLDRADMLYTSILLQMSHALARQRPPWDARSVRAWRRSWLLGYVSAVVGRVRAAEAQATEEQAGAEHAAGTGGTAGQPGVALVLRTREAAVQSEAAKAYPTTRKTRMTYSGRGYSSGHEAGQRANLGGTGVSAGQRRALG